MLPNRNKKGNRKMNISKKDAYILAEFLDKMDKQNDGIGCEVQEIAERLAHFAEYPKEQYPEK
jgi:hypothetical protein